MKPFLHRAQHNKGALMAAALLLVIVTGMFMSAWITLIGSRAVQVGYMQDAVIRRLNVENSRLFAWQCSMENAFLPGGTMPANVSGFLGVNLGGINTHDGWTSLNVFSTNRFPGSTTTVFPYNYTGVRPSSSYLLTEQLNRPVTLTAVDNFSSYSFLKSYPPVLAGDLFTYYRKPENSVYNSVQIDVYASSFGNASWVVNGRTVIRDPSSFFARTTPNPLKLPFQTKSLYVATHDPFTSRGIVGTSIGGVVGNLLPSNSPSVPSTTGPVSTANEDRYRGFLNVIKNDLNVTNSLWHFMDREKTAGRANYVTLDVYAKSAVNTGPYWLNDNSSAPSIYEPFNNEGSAAQTLYIQLDHPNLPHFRITHAVSQIVLLGQRTTSAFEAAGSLSPIMIAIVQDGKSPPLYNLELVGNNNRRIVIGYKTESLDTKGLYLHWRDWADETNSLSNPDWRMVYINEGRLTMLKLPDVLERKVRWIGGVMTNYTIKRHVPSGDNASRLSFVGDSTVPIVGTPAGPSYASLIPRDAWLESYFLPVQAITSAP